MAIAKPPTIREVAQEAGVSAMTVSRVLTGRGYVADDTAERVRAAFRRLNYRPNSAARLLRSRRSNLVGVTIGSLTSSVHRGIVAGVEEVLGRAEYQLLLGHLQAGGRRYSSFLEAVERQSCDGYIIVPSRSDAELTRVPHLDRPAVAALSTIPGLAVDRVVADGTDAVRAATTHLMERFGGPVALIATESKLSHDQSMLRGYREALAAAGQPELCLFTRVGDDNCRPGVRAMLARSEPPRGFVVTSSLLVFDAIGELVQSGRLAGQDVGVVPIASDERPWTALLSPPIPLMVVSAREIGRRAAELLLRRLREEEDTSASEPETLVVPMQFVSAPARADDPAQHG
jgi:LacI family transcriptional regulator